MNGLLSTDAAEVKRIAEMLCTCAKTRGHSIYCPALTARQNLGRALASHRERYLRGDEA
jgi:hypothetical protein